MPSVSKKQHNLMAMVANDPKAAKRVGIPQSVGKDFTTADKGKTFAKGGFATTKAKVNNQNTRHGKIDMPFNALNKYAGMAKGGDVKKEMKAANIFAKMGDKKLAAHERREAAGKEKDTPAIAKREMSVLKKAKAPKDVMDYEKGEHEGMKRGGKVKKYQHGGGVEVRGKSQGRIVKMASGGKVRKFAEGGSPDMEFADQLAEESASTPAKAPEKKQSFKEAFDEARAKGKGTVFDWNGKKVAAYRKGEEPESWSKNAPPKAAKPDMEEVTIAARRPKAWTDRKADANKISGEQQKAKEESDKYKAQKAADAAAARTRANAYSSQLARESADRSNPYGTPSMYKKGGSVKKFARGGGIESKGKTRGKFI